MKKVTNYRAFLLIFAILLAVAVSTLAYFSFIKKDEYGEPKSVRPVKYEEVKRYLGAEDIKVDEEGNYSLSTKQFEDYQTAKAKEEYEKLPQEQKDSELKKVEKLLENQDQAYAKIYKQSIVHPAGGQISIGGFGTLTFPEGYYTEPLLVTYSLKSASQSEMLTLTNLHGKTFEIVAETIYGKEVTKFDKNLKFEFESNVGDSKLYFFEEESQKWEELESSVNQEKVVAITNHFTNFQLSAQAPTVNPLSECGEIIDNLDSSPCFESKGFWELAPVGYKNTSLVTLSATPVLRGSAKWSTNLESFAEGETSVFVTMPVRNLKDPATGEEIENGIVKYEINTADGIVAVTVDQEDELGKVVKLGEYSFEDEGVVILDAPYRVPVQGIWADAVAFGGELKNIDMTPPQIENVRSIDLESEVVVEADITDNVGVASAWVLSQNMVEMTNESGDRYAAKASKRQDGKFWIIAYDTSGNESIWEAGRGLISRGTLGSSNYGIPPWAFFMLKTNKLFEIPSPKAGSNPCTQFCGDPINTQNGNLYEEFSVIQIDGNPEILLKLSYNSGGGRYGIFGETWSHSYNYKLVSMQNSYFSGAVLTYPDGRTVKFIGGELKPSEGNFDQLSREANGGYKLTKQDNTIVEFNTYGNPTRVEDLNGLGVSIIYENQDELSNLSKVKRILSDSGKSIEFSYDGDLVKKVQTNSGITVGFKYDGSQNLIEFTDSNSGVTKFEYQGFNIAKKTSPKGHAIYENKYDEQNRVVEQKAGEKFLQKYEYLQGKTVVTDRNSRTAIYNFNTEGLLKSMQDETGAVYIHEYNSKKQRTKTTDPAGNVVSMEYDERGNVTKLTDAEGVSWENTYDERFNKLASRINLSSSLKELWEYDSKGNLIKYTNQNGDTEEYTYNSKGLITKIRDFNDNETSFYYDQNGYLLKEQSENGAINSFEYDQNGRIEKIKTPRGNEWRYSYDTKGNVIKLTGPLGFENSFTYDANDHLTSFKDSLGNVTNYEYDASENLVREIDANGSVVEYTYGEMNEKISEKNKIGKITSYSYTPNYLVQKIVEGDLGSAQKEISFKYNPSRQLVGMIDPNGVESLLTLDKNARIVSEVRDVQNLSAENTYSYDSNGFVNKTVNPNGNKEIYEYDNVGRVTKMVDADGNHTNFEYDPNGNVLKKTMPNGAEYRYSYDSVNRLTKITNPEGGERKFEYDLEDNMVKETMENGVVNIYKYDALNRVVKKVENASNTSPLNFLTSHEGEELVTSYEYDLNSNLTKVTNPRGYETKFEYDKLNRLVSIWDAKNNQTKIAYDAEGNIVAIKDRNGFETKRQYDVFSRLVKEVNAEGGERAFAYDRNDNLIKSIDPNGNSTEYRYDGLNRNTELVDAKGNTTHLKYDLVGNLTEKIDALGNMEVYEHDRLNRLTKFINAEGHIETLGYDSVGNLISKSDANANHSDYEGNSISYEYDKLDRLVSEVNSLNGKKSYEYDEVGNLTKFIDENGNPVTFEIDPHDRIVGVTDAENNFTSYEYDPNGNLIKLIDANSNATNYSFDEVDNLVQITNALGEIDRFTYDNEQNPVAEFAPDGVEKAYNYDKIYRLIQVIEDSKGLSATTTYSYDPNGNLTQVKDPNGNSTMFSYDELNRQIAETNPLGNTWAYEYDAVGNKIMRKDANGKATNYEYYPDSTLKSIKYLASGASVDFTYDPNNNRLSMTDSLGTTSWMYDKLGRVTSVSDALDRSLQYEYDMVGNRVSVKYPDIDAQSGNTIRYSYMKNNWLKSVNVDEHGVEYARDAVGNLLQIKNSNNTVSNYEYDKVYRIKSIKNEEVGGKVNSHILYDYDQVGQRTKVQEKYAWGKYQDQVTSYNYDSLRRLVSSEKSSGNNVETNSYLFDLAGNRLNWKTSNESLTPTPFDPKKMDSIGINYEYNQANQLIRMYQDDLGNNLESKQSTEEIVVTQPTEETEVVTEQIPIPVISFAYLEKIKQFENHLKAQQGKQISDEVFNEIMSKLDELYKRAEEGLLSQGEASEKINGIRESISKIQNNGQVTSFLEQLKHVELAISELPEEIDYETRVTTRSVAGESTTTVRKENNGKKPQDYRDIIFTYDNNGNRVKKEIRDTLNRSNESREFYDYDSEDRLVGYRDDKQNSRVNMEYDGMGRRLVKSSHKHDRIEYLFDNLDPIADYNLKNGQFTNYYRGDGNRMVYMQNYPSGNGSQQLWYHYDALNSVVGVTKQDGQSSHNYDYEDYGNIVPEEGNFASPHNVYTYTGQMWDGDMGVYEFTYRAYDPSTGTWLQKDPYEGRVREPITLHKYAYGHLNPLLYVDPDGRAAQVAGAGYGVYLGGGVVVIGGIYVGKQVGLFDQTMKAPDLMSPGEFVEWLGISGKEKVGIELNAYDLFAQKIELDGFTYTVYNELVEGKYGCYGSREQFLSAEGILAEKLLNHLNAQEKTEKQEKIDKQEEAKDPTPRPEEKHPKDKLPVSGEQPYIPKPQKGSPEVVNNPESWGGYLDESGNVWKWNARQGHWDVQHPNGTHTNVNPDGNINHGPNNF